ncbi:hypothetical protein [Bdellovibrio bacteriovorus]|uniref:Uncharacterized protein n=1 Tax=Bdellovibrio bacteriovorus TaxID=959 RepID=A0A1Z3N6P5_BDEBC|nr:hypothetical protein [Bdellovibrio bacteriovorus]ASD63145.1 hypothetical protein B9G79_05975 [Bdellovibrio bacteriovorus]
MNQFISCLITGVLIVLSSVSAWAGQGPLPLPEKGYKVFSRIQFVDLTTEHPIRDRAFGDTLEVSFKSQLDQLYRLHNPPVRHLQFVERLPQADCDLLIRGTYTLRAFGNRGMHATVMVENIRTGETQSFEAAGDAFEVTENLALDVFHEFQKTRFPVEARVSGRNLTLLFKGAIYRPSASKMAELYRQSLVACEMRGGRVSTEKELVAISTLGDYGGGVSVGNTGVSSDYWSVEAGRVYVAPWSQSTSATSLNPTEQLNYLCVR